VGRHEAYRPTLGKRLHQRFLDWLRARNIVLPRLPRVRRGAFQPLFSFFFTVGLLAVTVVDPYGGTLTSASAMDYSGNVTGGQQVDEIAAATVSFARGGFNIIAGSSFQKIYVADAGKPDPGSAKAFAFSLSGQLGWGQDQYSCLVKLWTRESQWNALAQNTQSGAYGIPQALPGSKMASEGSDWATNPETQIRWGVKYILGRYKNPCTALVHSNNLRWY
jgi:hypothetical protein